MSLRAPRIPKYRHHKGSGQAFVQTQGERHYLGKYNTDGSQERYRRFVAELVSAPATQAVRPIPSKPTGLEVVELCIAYWEHAEQYYRKDGQTTDQLPHVKQDLRVLRELYGRTPAAEFGPLALQAVQQHLADSELSRVMVNRRLQGIKRVFKWGTSQELVPPAVYQALSTVPGLRRGRTTARECAPIQPVADSVVDATLPHLPAVVADMVRLQRATGCRPAECCMLRPADVDRSGDVWVYTPESHKTEHHGRERRIFIGPRGQEILRPYLLRESDSYCFSPIDSEKKRREEQHAARKTPLSCGNRPGTNRKRVPKRKPRDCYTTASYRRAIHRACDLAGIERWSPNRLRHSMGTEVRKQFGLEAAQVALGHAAADVTQVYAERDAELARKVARSIG